jgi:hypothetical protein
MNIKLEILGATKGEGSRISIRISSWKDLATHFIDSRFSSHCIISSISLSSFRIDLSHLYAFTIYYCTTSELHNSVSIPIATSTLYGSLFVLSAFILVGTRSFPTVSSASKMYNNSHVSLQCLRTAALFHAARTQFRGVTNTDLFHGFVYCTISTTSSVTGNVRP